MEGSIHPCDTLGCHKVLGHDGGCTPEPAIVLKEGETFKMCGKTLVGRGTDTYDPLCVRAEGHEGACWEGERDLGSGRVQELAQGLQTGTWPPEPPADGGKIDLGVSPVKPPLYETLDPANMTEAERWIRNIGPPPAGLQVPSNEEVGAVHEPASYYKSASGLEPFDIIDAFGLNYYEGAILLYLLRWRKKGDGVTDLFKIKHYVDELVERVAPNYGRSDDNDD